MTPSEMRAGVRAMRDRDFVQADRLARRGGMGTLRKRPVGMSDREWAIARAPRRAFFYH